MSPSSSNPFRQSPYANGASDGQMQCNVSKDQSTFNKIGGSQFNNNITIDFESVIRHVKESMSVVQDQHRSALEREKHAQLSVYTALSVHPTLAAMRPPTDILNDLDWYTELNTSFTSFTGIFRRFVQNPHFKRASTLGEEGTRARIMMLLLWVIGHRLPMDKIRQLVSTAIGDGMSVLRSWNNENGDTLLELHQVEGVVDQLAKMIKTRLPLPKESNPFYGNDFVVEDEDRYVPREELWVYDSTPGKGLPPAMRYEFDVKRNPIVLLHPLQGRVLVPQTKLSLLMIQWLTRNFGLGKKVFSPFDIDVSAFWNADPPVSTHLPSLLSDPSSSAADIGTEVSADSISMGSDIWMDVDSDSDEPLTIFDAFQELPLEDWIHFWFCSSYPVHAWAHDKLIRILLFTAYCGHQILPSPSSILLSTLNARYFREILKQDVIEEIQLHLLIESMGVLSDVAGDVKWDKPFLLMSKQERGVMLIFSDASSESLDPRSPMPSGPPAFQEAFNFLIDPAIYCPGEPDIIQITKTSTNLSFADHNNNTIEDSFEIPALDSSSCSCGKCIRVHRQFEQEGLENFQMRYIAWLRDEEGRHGCDALQRTWNPLIENTEEWVEENVLNRIESTLDILPSTSEDPIQLGITILHVLSAMHVKIGSRLDIAMLLRFVAFLRYSYLYPDSYLSERSLLADEKDLFAFVTPPDDEEPDNNRDLDEGQGDLTLCTSGGWLYDLAASPNDSDIVYVLAESPSMTIRFISMKLPSPSAVHMARMHPIPPMTIPHAHALLDAPETPDPPFSSYAHNHTNGSGSITHNSEPVVTIDLSLDAIHGFPRYVTDPDDPAAQLSAAAGGKIAEQSSREGYSAQISVMYHDRLVRTWWRPEVIVGQPCTHKAEYGRITCCSVTSNQILLQIPPLTQCPPTPVDKADFPQAGMFSDISIQSNDNPAGSVAFAQYLEYQKYATVRLTERDSPLEHGRMCIVRCSEPGNEDDEGPADPLIILAASLRIKSYILNIKECCICACERMRGLGCGLGIVMISSSRGKSGIGNRVVTKCGHCTFADERAKRIITGYER